MSDPNEEIVEEDEDIQAMKEACEPISVIQDHRKRKAEIQKKKSEFEKLKAERLELELEENIRKEKQRIEELLSKRDQPLQIKKEKSKSPKEQTIPVLQKVEMRNGKPVRWCEEHKQLEYIDE